MKAAWSYRMVDPARYQMLYGPHVLAEVLWTRVLAQPALTMARMVDGLNGVAGVQPARTWSWGNEWSPGRFELLHNGSEVGEWAWDPPAPHRIIKPELWLGRVLDGLNRVVGRHLPPPEPAAIAPVLQRDVRAAS